MYLACIHFCIPCCIPFSVYFWCVLVRTHDNEYTKTIRIPQCLCIHKSILCRILVGPVGVRGVKHRREAEARDLKRRALCRERRTNKAPAHVRDNSSGRTGTAIGTILSRPRSRQCTEMRRPKHNPIPAEGSAQV